MLWLPSNGYWDHLCLKPTGAVLLLLGGVKHASGGMFNSTQLFVCLNFRFFWKGLIFQVCRKICLVCSWLHLWIWVSTDLAMLKSRYIDHYIKVSNCWFKKCGQALVQWRRGGCTTAWGMREGSCGEVYVQTPLLLYCINSSSCNG